MNKRPFELVAEIQDKDAEIVAMAKLAVLLKQDIAEKDAEIERLKKMYAEMFCFREDLILENMELRTKIEGLKNCSDVNWVRVKAILTRAADALERPETRAYMQQWVESLIAELRKAAE